MPRAIGANSLIHMIPEVTYGTAPGGNWYRMPFMTTDLGEEQPLIPADVIGVGNNRDPGAPFLDTVSVNGQIMVPIDTANFGWWLRLLFGAPTTTGESPDYTHRFDSGAASLTSNSIEVAYPDVPRYFVYTGVRANTLELDFSPTGPATASIGMIGQGSSNTTTSAAGTPTQGAYQPFNKALGSITRNGAPFGAVTGARLTYSNGIEAVRTIRADRKIEGADPGIASATGQITVRFDSIGLFNEAAAGTPSEIEMAYTISAARNLNIKLYEVYTSVAKAPIQGPAGVEATFDFRAAFNATATRMLDVTLNNGVESYA
jgi:hypothetical protein